MGAAVKQFEMGRIRWVHSDFLDSFALSSNAPYPIRGLLTRRIVAKGIAANAEVPRGWVLTSVPFVSQLQRRALPAIDD
jgi:hypothetical protein